MFTSTTPGTWANCGRMIQSCTSLKAIGVTGEPSGNVAPSFPSSVYTKISPSPVAIGPISGSRPSGKTLLRLASLSSIKFRAKKISVPSSKITVICERPYLDIERV